MLTMDQEYINRFRVRPSSYRQRMLLGVQAAGVGIYEGITGQTQSTRSLECILCTLSPVCSYLRSSCIGLCSALWHRLLMVLTSFFCINQKSVKSAELYIASGRGPTLLYPAIASLQ